MSYLPSSRLYEREPEPLPAAPPVAAAPKPAPPAMPPAPPARRTTMAPKEWLVAPAPVLHVDVAPPPVREPVIVVAPPIETVTIPASQAPPADEPKGRKRNIFHKAHKVVLRHLDRSKNKTPESTDPAEPDLLWFAVMVTGSLCMGLMIWGAYSALPRFGNIRTPLRADVSTHRLKSFNDVPGQWVRETGPIHAQPHVPPLMAPVAQPYVPPPVHAMPMPAPPLHAEPPHDARLPEIGHSAPVPMESPLAPLPERKDPVVFLHANLGETPMIRNWNELAKTTFLLTALAVPANNLLAGGNLQVDYTKQIDELTKAVKLLTEQVAGMKIDDKLTNVESRLNEKISKIKLDAPKADNIQFELLGARLDQLEKAITQLARNPGGAAPAIPVAANVNLDDIKSRLGSIEQAILKLQPSEKRLALSPPSSPDAAIAKPGGTSNVIFVNLYSQDLWLWVNQKQHRAPAGTTLTLDNIPAGPATIEVRSPEGIFHKANPTLNSNETFTLTAK